MIYSNNVEKICALCRNSTGVTGTEEHLECKLRNEYMPLNGSCDRFEYDIFKKPTRRKRRLDKQYKAEDFKL